MKQFLYTTGGILLLIGLASKLIWGLPAIYIYCAGALLFAVMQCLDRYEGNNTVIHRLKGIQILGALLLVVTGVLMFVTRHNEWMVSIAVAALMELYSVFRISHELEKEEEKKGKK